MGQSIQECTKYILWKTAFKIFEGISDGLLNERRGSLDTGRALNVLRAFRRRSLVWSGGVVLKKVCLKISQSSQENTCARVSFLITLLKKRLWHRCFPVNFVKFLRTPFLTELLRWLLLLIDLISSVRLVWLRELLRLEEKKILILHKQSECGNSLKLDSHLPKIFFWFPSMIVPQKWWKMLFISS